MPDDFEGQPCPLDELAGRLEGEADQVDDHVGLQITHMLGKGAHPFLGVPIDHQVLDGVPCGVRLVGLALPATDDHDLMPRRDEPRDQIGPDVVDPADDHDTHRCLPRYAAASAHRLLPARRCLLPWRVL